MESSTAPAEVSATDSAAAAASECQAPEAESDELAAAADAHDRPKQDSLRRLWPQDVLYDNIVQVHAPPMSSPAC